MVIFTKESTLSFMYLFHLFVYVNGVFCTLHTPAYSRLYQFVFFRTCAFPSPDVRVVIEFFKLSFEYERGGVTVTHGGKKERERETERERDIVHCVNRGRSVCFYGEGNVLRTSRRNDLPDSHTILFLTFSNDFGTFHNCESVPQFRFSKLLSRGKKLVCKRSR